MRTPLSWDLRVFPQPGQMAKPGYPFGGPIFRMAAFQKFISFAVLLPESFRGGCSFGPLRSPKGEAGCLPRGILCWPSQRASRRTAMLRRILKRAWGESIIRVARRDGKPRPSLSVLNRLAAAHPFPGRRSPDTHILSGTSMPRRSRIRVSTAKVRPLSPSRAARKSVSDSDRMWCSA